MAMEIMTTVVLKYVQNHPIRQRALGIRTTVVRWGITIVLVRFMGRTAAIPVTAIMDMFIRTQKDVTCVLRVVMATAITRLVTAVVFLARLLRDAQYADRLGSQF